MIKVTTEPEKPTEDDPLEQTQDVELDDLGLPAHSEEEPSEQVQRRQATQAARSRGPKKRERRSQVNPAALKIETNIKIPATQRKGRSSAWIPVLKQMEVGDSLNVPDTTANKMGYVREIAKKLGLTIVVRANGTGARLWRVSAESFSEDGL